MNKKIIEAYIACAEQEWARPIRDTQWHSSSWVAFMNKWKIPKDKWEPTTEGDKGHIARIIRSNGGHWDRTMRARGYSEAKGDAWCGLGIGHCMRHVGEFVEPGMCVDLTLDPDIAEHVLPSTYRISVSSFWAKTGHKKIKSLKPEDIQRGDVVTIVTGENNSYGDHYVIALDSPKNGRFDTVEFNGYGLLGNGNYGEGVVKRLAEMGRSLKDVRGVYRFTKEHFEGAYLG